MREARTPEREAGGQSRDSSARSRGASLIETAIVLPVALGAIFVIIGIAIMLNARSGLTSGMSQALRLANTRGNAALMGESVLGALDTYAASSSPGFTPIAPLLSSNVSETDAAAFYNTCFGAVYGVELRQLPPQYLYTLAYLHQALKQTIGPSIRFPCAPPGGAPPTGLNNCQPPAPSSREPGCIACYLLDSRDLDLNPQTIPAGGGALSLDPNRIALRCEYSPASVFISPAIALLGLFQSGGVSGPAMLTITRDRVFEATRIGLQ